MSEERLQIAVVKYIKLQYPKTKYCASLGGIYTSPTQAAKSKRTGYQRGFPDLQICEARGGYFGLFIELKTLKGKPTIAQKEWIAYLNAKGYKAEICIELPEALECIDSYMSKGITIGCKCDG